MDEITKKAVKEAFDEEFSLKKIFGELALIVGAIILACSLKW